MLSNPLIPNINHPLDFQCIKSFQDDEVTIGQKLKTEWVSYQSNDLQIYIYGHIK